MTANIYRAGRYVSQPSRDPEEPKGFCNTVKTVEGVTPPSRWRPEGQSGVHWTSVDAYEQHDTSHQPYSSAHHPEPYDLGALKKHQQDMISKRQKAKNKREEKS